MIYRRWSLLTGPTALVAGVVATVAVANFILVKNVTLSLIHPSYAVDSSVLIFVEKD